MKAAELILGRTYFRLTFSDPNLTMPGVEPLVYLGQVADDSGTEGIVFQDTASYIQHGSGLEGEEQHEDIVLYFMPETELGAIYTLAELSAEIVESAKRGAELNYPHLEGGGN
jgi:hypothetical protein